MSALAKNQQLQTEIDARRAGALAEIALVRGEMRMLDQRLAALHDLVGFCDEAACTLAEAPVASALRRRNVGVRKVVLDLLAETPGRGLTILEIADGITRRTSQGYHPKTPSMTLTRLRREGQAEFDGKRWRLAKRSPAQTSN